MSSKTSKNNPDARGPATKLRKYNGKLVKPVRFIKRGVGSYMAAAYEDGSLVFEKGNELPIAYKSINAS
jgi:hypothetical protein